MHAGTGFRINKGLSSVEGFGFEVRGLGLRA
jgi:hypothetical protein